MKNELKKRENNKELLKDQKGLSTIEYIILLVVIVVAGISLWQELGGLVTDRLGNAKTAVGTL